jgi:hypothetical protein
MEQPWRGKIIGCRIGTLASPPPSSSIPNKKEKLEKSSNAGIVIILQSKDGG